MERDLIETYLTDLRRSLRWRRDADDLVDEAADHLRSSVARLEAHGVPAEDAAVEAVAAFGSVDDVARAHLMGPSGRLAVATDTTRMLGRALQVGALAWLVVAVFWSGAAEETGWTGWAEGPAYMGMVIALAFGLSTTLILSIALADRHGGFGWIGRAGVVLCGVAALLSVLAWATVFWMSVLAVSLALVGLAVAARQVVPRRQVLALVGAMPIGITVFLVLRAAEVGTRDEWGNHPLADALGVTVAAIGVAGAVWSIGRRLAREEPFPADGETFGIVAPPPPSRS